MDEIGGRRLLTVPETAAYLRYKPGTLSKFRREGVGPVYHNLAGRVVYDAEDLEAWLASRRVRPVGERRSAKFLPITVRAAEALKPVMDQAMQWDREMPGAGARIVLTAAEKTELLGAWEESQRVAEGVR